INPVLPIVDKRGTFTGSIINFGNPVQKLASKLPCKSNYLLIDSVSPHGRERQLFVNASRISESLTWLEEHNKFYRDVQIDTTSQQRQQPQLPTNATAAFITSDEASAIEAQLECFYNTNLTVERNFFSVVKEGLQRFLGRETQPLTIINIVKERCDKTIKPLDEPGYLQKAFPHLFLSGELRSDNLSRLIPISMVELAKHIGLSSCRRLVNDPILPFVLLDLKLKRQVRTITSFLLQRNPAEALMAPANSKHADSVS
ncbi:MAG: hypothetical protein MHMPM18_000579, partial [Marteilia pararefringens]